MKKIALYSPFMSDNIGGGERYLLACAECLLAQNCQVDLLIQQNSLTTPAEKQKLKNHFIKNFELDLNGLNIVNAPFSSSSSAFKIFKFTSQYDFLYYMTDGSFFVPGSRNSAVHFMIPFSKPTGSFSNRLKLKSWKTVTANSFFTKKIIQNNWKVKVDYVHWGAVDLSQFKPGKKENIILHVGRFFSSSGNKHCKRQDILVEAFKKMCDNGLKKWTLIMVGAIDKGKDNHDYAEKIEKISKNYPIQIKHNIPFSELKQIYAKSKIYWHATGFDLDENKNPMSMEHLGLTTVEAMSAGVVPVVINKAGQKEIVSSGKDGLFWETEDNLISQTQRVINDSQLLSKLSKQARVRAQDFSKEKFCQMTKKIFDL